MRTLGSALVIVVLLAGCGGDDRPSMSAEETAQAWVDAINAEDYERACDLSVFEARSDCLDLMRSNPFGDDLELEGFYASEGEAADSEGTFAISSDDQRNPPDREGWTAYAPLDGFDVERHGDQYKVHFETSVIN